MSESQNIEYKEAWGRGIERIINACKNAEVPAPQFKCSGGELWTTFPFSEAYKNALSETAQKDSNLELTNGDPINALKNALKNIYKISDNDKIDTIFETNDALKNALKNALKMLNVINDKNTISMDEMAVSLQVSRRYLANLIKVLKDAGIIRRVGSVKSGHWEIVQQSIGNRFLI